MNMFSIGEEKLEKEKKIENDKGKLFCVIEQGLSGLLLNLVFFFLLFYVVLSCSLPASVNLEDLQRVFVLCFFHWNFKIQWLLMNLCCYRKLKHGGRG